MQKKKKVKKTIKSNKKEVKINKKEKVSAKKINTQSNLNSAEVKVQIKKIKKQATEKKLYNIKDYVVYPKHGVGKIVAVEKAKIGEIEITFYNVLIEKEKLTLSIPLNQQSHLRHISSINQITKAISILKSKPRVKRTMWSRRAQEYDQKIKMDKALNRLEDPIQQEIKA